VKTFFAVAELSLFLTAGLCAQSRQQAHPQDRREAEYYASMYARHYRVPVSLVRAIIERESNWRVCAVSAKGAKGLMQLMPASAQR
jgi:soluble lytic murein transglycosylase-like protein